MLLKSNILNISDSGIKQTGKAWAVTDELWWLMPLAEEVLRHGSRLHLISSSLGSNLWQHQQRRRPNLPCSSPNLAFWWNQQSDRSDRISRLNRVAKNNPQNIDSGKWINTLGWILQNQPYSVREKQGRNVSFPRLGKYRDGPSSRDFIYWLIY